MQELPTKDPSAHVQNIRKELDELIAHLRRDVAKIEEPRARALFETAAEALTGLEKAFAHYSDQSEAAWR